MSTVWLAMRNGSIGALRRSRADPTAVRAYSPDQERDEHGRWAGGGVVDVVGPAHTKRNEGETIGEATAASFSPDTLTKIDAQIAATMGGITPAQGEQNLRDAFAKAQDNPEAMAAASWYFDAHEVAAGFDKTYGVPEGTSAAIFAAISPLNQWATPDGRPVEAVEVEAILAKITDPTATVNVDQGAIDKFNLGELAHGHDGPFVVNGMPYSQLDGRGAAWALRQEYKADNVDNPNAIGWGISTYDGFAKGVDIARGASPDEVLNGYKVRSFDNNIAHPESGRDVTIDARMVQAYTANRAQKSDDTVMVSHSEAGLTMSPYVRIADSVRNITADYNAAHPEAELLPHQVQAIIWTDWGPNT